VYRNESVCFEEMEKFIKEVIWVFMNKLEEILHIIVVEIMETPASLG